VWDYKSSTMGLGARLGVPLNERDTIFFGGAVERLDLTTNNSSPFQYQKYVADYGNTTDTLRLDTSFTRDTRNNYLYPTSGMLQSVALEFGAPPADVQYYKLSLKHQQYFPLSQDFTLMVNGEIGYGGGLGDSSDLPFYRNYFVGGVTSVRGFASGSIGPMEIDPNNGKPVSVGGDSKMVGNVELLFPMPGIKDNSVRLSTFLDTGAAFGNGDSTYGSNDFSLDNMRVSGGLGVAWNSPLGPLKFSLAYPIVSKKYDTTEVFQFTMGSVF
jgi:outer membrane protein insertion porin family